MNLCTVKWFVRLLTSNSSDNLPSYLQTTIIAQTLSIGRKGAQSHMSTQLITIPHSSPKLKQYNTVIDRFNIHNITYLFSLSNIQQSASLNTFM